MSKESNSSSVAARGFCQKCQEAIVNAYGEKMREAKMSAWIGRQFVPESECEFRAHKQLNEIKGKTQDWGVRREIEAMLKELDGRTREGYKAANRGVRFEIAFKDADEIRWKKAAFEQVLALLNKKATERAK